LAELLHIGHIQDFPPGEAHSVEAAEDEEVVVVNLDGQLYALSNYCTHICVRLAIPPIGAIVYDDKISCWMHGSTYDVRTGESLWGPGDEPLTVYEVRVDDGEVYLGRGAIAFGSGVEPTAPASAEA
jgi:3-phenylpropionate/trans-cinnamate dioxygenase ferredoxin subunit